MSPSSPETGPYGELEALAPDVVALQEAWCDRGGQDQATRLAKALGYHGAYGGGTFLAEDWGTGSGLLSRWPIEHHEYRESPASAPDRWGGAALFGRIAGPRGPLSAFSVALDWPPHASAVRQSSVRHLVSFALEVAGPAFPTVICGDFNAPPDSDELRMLTGRVGTAAPGFALCTGLFAGAAIFLLGSLIPFTLIVILPTNKRLLDAGLAPGSPETAALLTRWGRLPVRSVVSAIVFLLLGLHRSGMP